MCKGNPTYQYSNYGRSFLRKTPAEWIVTSLLKMPWDALVAMETNFKKSMGTFKQNKFINQSIYNQTMS